MNLFTWFHRARIDQDLDDELRSHIELRAGDLERTGLTRAEAHRRARIEFGGFQRFKEESREALAGRFLETLFQDIRFSLRAIRKSPGFTVVAVLTLALAIAANAVVFGLLNGLIIRPLDVPRSESLYGIGHPTDTSMYQSYPDYLDLRDRNRSFEALAAFNMSPAALDSGDNPSRVWIYEVTGNYFDALAIQPYLGRLLHASDEHGPNSAPYIVLTWTFWHTHFADDRTVVGRTVLVNKHPFTIVGVAPPGFQGTILFFSPDFFLPMVNAEQIEGVSNLNARGTEWVFMTLGHLKAGVTPAQAVADLNSIGTYLVKTYPRNHEKLAFALQRPGLYGDYLGRPVRAFLSGLMLLAGLILLAACANLGSLFAARAADRSRELALRLALGSSRSRILRALFTEAGLISLLGGAAGLMGSVTLLHGLTVWQPIPGLHIPVDPDANVYAVALLLALVSALLFGMVPVRQVLRTDAYQVIKSGTTGTVGRRITVRELLLGAQIAICAVLVTSSMVSVRGLLRSLHSNFGFEPRGAMLMDTDLRMAGYRGDAVPAMQKHTIDAVARIPGVTSVGLIDWLPLKGAHAHSSPLFTDETTDLRPSNALAEPAIYHISPEYLLAAGTTLLSGRAFSWHDDQDAPRVAVVNQEFARRFCGSLTAAAGRYYRMQDGTRVQVVGVVENGKYRTLPEDPEPAMFFPLLQWPFSETTLVVRSNRDPQPLAIALRTVLRKLDAGLPSTIRTWNEELNTALLPSRVATVSLGLMGAMGALLSITGIFGLAAYSVSKRKRELGIRLALGAQRQEILQAALGRALKLLAFGSTAGLLLGILASRVLAYIVYQATPRDALVLTSVVLAMALLGLVATWIPARRALSLNPVSLLRED